MSIHHVSIANAAVATFVSTVLSVLLSTASADSTTTRAVGPRQTIPVRSSRKEMTEQVSAAMTSTRIAQGMEETHARGKQPGSCVTVDRPKHTIRKCRCDSGALSGVASIDVAEMIRLLLGSSACRSPAPSRKRG
jgi:hypothetical protein